MGSRRRSSTESSTGLAKVATFGKKVFSKGIEDLTQSMAASSLSPDGKGRNGEDGGPGAGGGAVGW